MTIKVFNSKNYPALKITGVAGSLLPIFDEILLNTGWTKPFIGTNANTYRSGIGSTQKYYFINDAGLLNGSFRNAAVRGYTVMTTATDAGTNPFPTTTQLATGAVIRKSNTLDTTPREWYAIVSERFCYLFIASGETAGVFNPYCFGDFNSYKALETRNSYVSGYSADATTFSPGNFGILRLENGYTNVNGAANYVAGDCNTGSVYDTGSGKDISRTITFHTDMHKGGLTSFSGGIFGPVSRDTRDWRLSKLFFIINDGTNALCRGELPGFSHICNSSYSSGVVNSSNGEFPEYSNFYVNGLLQTDRKFVLINTTNGNPTLWEISNTY